MVAGYDLTKTGTRLALQTTVLFCTTKFSISLTDKPKCQEMESRGVQENHFLTLVTFQLQTLTWELSPSSISSLLPKEEGMTDIGDSLPLLGDS